MVHSTIAPFSCSMSMPSRGMVLHFALAGVVLACTLASATASSMPQPGHDGMANDLGSRSLVDSAAGISVSEGLCGSQGNCLGFQIRSCKKGQRQVCMFWKPTGDCTRGSNQAFPDTCTALDQDSRHPLVATFGWGAWYTRRVCTNVAAASHTTARFSVRDSTDCSGSVIQDLYSKSGYFTGTATCTAGSTELCNMSTFNDESYYDTNAPHLATRYKWTRSNSGRWYDPEDDTSQRPSLPKACEWVVDVKSCPSESPTATPTLSPSKFPSPLPTAEPTQPVPTSFPSANPSSSPTIPPPPTNYPSIAPSAYPTFSPTETPTDTPTDTPTKAARPMGVPTDTPSNAPTRTLTSVPTPAPTDSPSLHPSEKETLHPTILPSTSPSSIPSNAPTSTPTYSPAPVCTEQSRCVEAMSTECDGGERQVCVKWSSKPGCRVTGLLDTFREACASGQVPMSPWVADRYVCRSTGKDRGDMQDYYFAVAQGEGDVCEGTFAQDDVANSGGGDPLSVRCTPRSSRPDKPSCRGSGVTNSCIWRITLPKCPAPATATPTKMPTRGPDTSTFIKRKEFRELTQEEWEAYKNAVIALERNGVWGTYAEIHRVKFTSGIHRRAAFWPWHREYLRAMELELKNVSPTPELVALHYWDWTLDAGGIQRAPLFDNDHYGAFQSGKGCLTGGPFAGAFSALRAPLGQCLSRRPAIASSPGFDMSQIATSLSVNYVNLEQRYYSVRSSIEAFHNTVHVAVGSKATMGSFQSPYDPVFWTHHAFVDMLWSLWQLDPEHPENLEAYNGAVTSGLAWYGEENPDLMGDKFDEANLVSHNNPDFQNRKVEDTLNYHAMPLNNRRRLSAREQVWSGEASGAAPNNLLAGTQAEAGDVEMSSTMPEQTTLRQPSASYDSRQNLPQRHFADGPHVRFNSSHPALLGESAAMRALADKIDARFFETQKAVWKQQQQQQYRVLQTNDEAETPPADSARNDTRVMYSNPCDNLRADHQELCLSIGEIKTALKVISEDDIPRLCPPPEPVPWTEELWWSPQDEALVRDATRRYKLALLAHGSSALNATTTDSTDARCLDAAFVREQFEAAVEKYGTP